MKKTWHRRLIPWCGSLVLSVIVLLIIVWTASGAAMMVIVSRSSTGNLANGYSYNASLSAYGRYAAFSSAASNLVPGDTNGLYDIFVKDTQTGVTILASSNAAGVQGNGKSSMPFISADGRYVAFDSAASNLVSNDVNNTIDVFIKNTQTGIVLRVSTDSAGAEANSDSSSASISQNQRYVAFYSQASNLVPGDSNNRYDVFFKDMQTGATSRVSTSSGGQQANSDSMNPSISADGNLVAFYSSASNMVYNDTNRSYDVFVKDTQTGTATRVSTDPSGQEGNSFSYNPVISADGRYVAFNSAASNFVYGDTNNFADIFVKDLQTGGITSASTDSSGQQANASSYIPAISGDGRFVAFYSGANNLVPGDTNGAVDVFVKDLSNGQIIRVSTSASGAEGNGGSRNAVISADGKYIGFYSSANNLVPADNNSVTDIFVASNDLLTADGVPPVVSAVVPSGNIYTDSAVVSAYYSDPSPSSGINVSSATLDVYGATVSSCSADQSHISCTASGLGLGEHTITGSIADNAGNTAAISGNFNVLDNVAPVVTAVSPSGNIETGAAAGSQYSSAVISAYYEDPNPSSGINPASASLAVYGGIVSDCVTNEQQISCTASYLGAGSHAISGSISDNAGNTAFISGSFYVCSGKPELNLTSKSYWASLSDYIYRKLSVKYSLSNGGGYTAYDAKVTADSPSGGVARITQLPISVGDVNPGGSASFTVKYQVPLLVLLSFNSGSTVRSRSDCGGTFDTVFTTPVSVPLLPVLI